MKELTEEQKNLIDRLEEPTKEPNPLFDGLVQWSKTLDFDKLEPNSVIVIKISIDDPIRFHNMQVAIVKQLLESRYEKLKEKRVGVMFISSDDDISVMDEKQMESAGWIRKNKSIIINPFDKL